MEQVKGMMYNVFNQEIKKKDEILTNFIPYFTLGFFILTHGYKELVYKRP